MPRKTALAKPVVTVLCAGAVVLLLVRCGSSSNTSSSSLTFTAVYSNTLQPECARCHIPNAAGSLAGATINFTTQASAFQSLTGAKVSARDVVGTCGSVNLVTPGTASTSYITATTISSSYSTNFVVAGCTPYSHPGLPALSATDISNLVGWINAGAPNN
jgi:hypothetical protein